MAAAKSDEPKLLWNPDNVKDVAESVGISQLSDEALRCLSQDVEYRIGQVIVEALRFMRACNRTTLTVQDVSQALKVLDVEPLYGYESTRPLRYGEASLGPGQPLFYIEDEEVDFEKLINAPLPKVPRDASFTGMDPTCLVGSMGRWSCFPLTRRDQPAHWLAIEGVQPSIPQNPTTAESRSQELVPKGPGANPALAALAGNDNVSFKPSVKHIISKELVLYFDKIQAAILDDNPDEEVLRLREAALESVRSDPGLHQLVPYFVNFITNQVTHRLDDTFTLRQMMELTSALVDNPSLFLDPYAAALSAPVLTCLMSRKLGSPSATAAGDDGDTSPEVVAAEQYKLRELSASLLGQIARNYARSNALLRPKLTRTCLKYLLDPSKPAPVLYGAVSGLAAAGGPEAVRVLVLPNMKAVDAAILQPLRERETNGGTSTINRLDYEMLVGGFVKAIRSITAAGQEEGGLLAQVQMNGVNHETSEQERSDLVDFLGPIVGGRVADLGDRQLNKAVAEARSIE
ncbi:uncharacterized protein E0L32_009292 [Thyridium curvatum]|uniref:TBP-associated factor 6 n=1 Tax=Thyridium curvatum TaxID=1093900 RepID=A0A507AX34_9PEZI|nr:uncharacterized protein E0L32_009292 [Thyridium curvatum]TPX09549.1 hypothetical protein E0L32_009292 [Thyridium curvatum]